MGRSLSTAQLVHGSLPLLESRSKVCSQLRKVLYQIIVAETMATTSKLV